MRRLWLAACRVSRSQARTRRSSAARAASGNWRGCSPAGSTSGSRARVSASIPLDLAWRDSTRRRSWALAELTRYTMWPRLVKNTAIGSHAGPVGSTTTSRRVAGATPARAACSTSARLSTVGAALRRQTRLPSLESTRTVWALAIGKVAPDQPSVVHLVASLAVVACWAAAPRGQRWVTATVPRVLCPTTAPTHVLQPAPTLPGRATSLIRGIRGRPRAAIRRTRLDAPAPSSEEDSTPPPEPAGMHMQPWDLGADQAPRSLT